MTCLTEEPGTFVSQFEHFEKRMNPGAVPWVRRLRTAAIARFGELGLPTTKHEEWRFTDVSRLATTTFEPARPPSRPMAPERLRQATSLAPGSHRLVFVNGRYSHNLSSIGRLPDGVIAGSLAEVLSTHPELVEAHLGRYASYREHPFVALNTAFLGAGAFVYVPPGIVVEEPFHLLYLTAGLDRASVVHGRNLILAGRNTETNIVEDYVGLDESPFFTNVVTEVVLEDNATMEHYKVQREGEHSFHMGTVQVRQGRDSRLSSALVSFGGLLVRNETNTVLDAEGCQAALNGLYMAGGQQHMDCRTRIDHAKPQCFSRELYKGILDDSAKGVFNGKIIVHQDAQKTDARQTNQTLLLSENAVIDTKPQLEIFADDVKCTHGATVGRLDEEALFYLRSRGIPLDRARNLLVYAFADDVVGRIRAEGVRRQLEQTLLAARGLPADARLGRVA